MSKKFDCSRPLGKSLVIEILVISFFSLLAVSCISTVEQPKPSQSDLPQPTFSSPSLDLNTEPTPTPTPIQRTTTPTNAFQASSTHKPPTPTVLSDELIPADMTAVNETQEAYEFALLQTPSPTPTLDVPLNESGPWLVDKIHEDLILMNLDGTGLTRTTIDRYWRFPWWWSLSSISGGNWLSLEIGKKPEYRDVGLENFPDDLAYLLLQIPPGQIEKNIPLLSPEMILEIRQVEYWMPFPTIIHALFSSPIQWSPDGRYLAFVAALHGPSSDLYVYDTATDQIRRLTDGPNEAYIMSWSPDSQWILHAEVTSYATHTVLIEGRPRVKAVWVASPDGNQVRKVHDVDKEVVQFQAWLSPSVYIEQTIMAYQNDQFNINGVDIRSGEMTSIYPCFGSFTGITSDGDIIFWSAEYTETKERDAQYTCNDHLPSGYYVFRDGNSFPLPQPLSEAKWKAKWNSALEKFLLKTPKGIEMLDLSGQLITTFPQEKCDPVVSPNGQWLAFWSPCDEDYERDRRIRFYNPEGYLLQEYSFSADCFYWNPDTPLKVDCLYWNPDSSGVFLQDGSQLWFLSPHDGEPVLIHPDSGMYAPFVVGE